MNYVFILKLLIRQSLSLGICSINVAVLCFLLLYGYYGYSGVELTFAILIIRKLQKTVAGKDRYI